MNIYFRKIAGPIFNRAQKSKLGRKSINIVFLTRKFIWRFNNKTTAGVYLVKNIHKIFNTNPKLSYAIQIKKLLDKVNIQITDENFIFFLDEFKILSYNNIRVDNISIDYSRTLDNSLHDFKEFYSLKKVNNTKNIDFIQDQLDMIEGIELFILKIIDAIKNSNRQDKDKFIGFFENIINKKATHFEESLQRILFYNQVLWQTGHYLNGLGRLDKILQDLYYNDINNNFLTKEEAFNLIKNFLKSLHSYYWYKSTAFLGDTGQVIILGGKETDGTYFYNDLTYLFIEAINQLQLPDPKALLRVSKDTPRDLIELSLKTMNTGCGSPLLSNDDIVIDKMIEFGYDADDAYNYVVSACWEPSAVGKGLEQNNINFLSFLKPLNNIFDNESEEFINSINDFDNLFETYKTYLKIEANNLIDILDDVEFNTDPILSMFIDNCKYNQLDVSNGGAKYNHYGITTVSLANTVNSLYNIKQFVFKDKKFSLTEFKNIRKDNFTDCDDLLEQLKTNPKHFGCDDEEIISLTNEIIEYLENCFKDYRNKFGGRIKFGLSSPSYISGGEIISASFDGRRNGEPFSTHISADLNNDYTELMRFASKIDYEGCKFNGNVVDLMVSPNFIKNNFEKFTDYILLSIKLGFYQMQMNVVDSKTLIEAKAHPELHTNLIVRVWGFSSYFNDLPLSYKDLLIERALKNERKLSF